MASTLFLVMVGAAPIGLTTTIDDARQLIRRFCADNVEMTNADRVDGSIKVIGQQPARTFYVYELPIVSMEVP